MDALAPLIGSQTTSNNTNITIAGGMVGTILDKYANSLQAELPFYWTLIGAWCVVFVMGVIGTIWLSYQTSPIVSAEDATKKPMDLSSELQEEKIDGKIDSPPWSMLAAFFKPNPTSVQSSPAMEMADVDTKSHDSNKSIPTIVTSNYDDNEPHDEYYHASPVNYTVPHEPKAPSRVWAHNTQRYSPEVTFAREPGMAQAGSVATNSVSPFVGLSNKTHQQQHERSNVPTEASVQPKGSSLLDNARGLFSASNASTSSNTVKQSSTRDAIRENIQEAWVPTAAVMHTQQVPRNAYGTESTSLEPNPFADPIPVVSSSGVQKYVPLEEEVHVAHSTITGGADLTNQPLKKANSNRTMHSDEYSLFTRDFKDEPTQQPNSKVPFPASVWQSSAQRDSTPTSLASSTEVDKMLGSTSSGEWSLKAKTDSPTAGRDPAFSAQMASNPFDDPVPSTDTRGVQRIDSETGPKNVKSLGISIDTIATPYRRNTDSPLNPFRDDGEVDDESEADHPDDSSSLSSWRFASSQPTSLTTSPTSPTGPPTPVRMTSFSGMDSRH